MRKISCVVSLMIAALSGGCQPSPQHLWPSVSVASIANREGVFLRQTLRHRLERSGLQGHTRLVLRVHSLSVRRAPLALFQDSTVGQYRCHMRIDYSLEDASDQRIVHKNTLDVFHTDSAGLFAQAINVAGDQALTEKAADAIAADLHTFFHNGGRNLWDK